MQERRRFARIPENSQINYEVPSDIKAKDFLTRDLSRGGIRFFAHEFISKDSLLKIRLTLEKIPFSFEAFVKVIWVREDASSQRYEAGAEFIDIPKRAGEYLTDYIKNILEYK